MKNKLENMSMLNFYIGAKHNKKGLRTRGIIAAIAGIILLLATIMSVFYIAMESHHHCEEENCPICACIELCKAIIHSGSFVPLIICYPFLFLFTDFFFSKFFTIETPVSRRIRMNN
ncbi:MAG: hypothetical protein K5930_06465 [Treponemataceae bacterium]|nr:hypothetical protein [Treponemataceae bacterium]